MFQVASHCKFTGGRNLILHSAGSGKTKTIAWTSHRAGRLIGADGKPVFDSVVVVTDRTVLDENIKEGLDLLRASEGLVVNVDTELGSKSKTLEAALSRGGHIISCTIRTFPALSRMMEKSLHLAGRNYCAIMDEAHSSQHGEAAQSCVGFSSTQKSLRARKSPVMMYYWRWTRRWPMQLEFHRPDGNTQSEDSRGLWCR